MVYFSVKIRKYWDLLRFQFWWSLCSSCVNSFSPEIIVALNLVHLEGLTFTCVHLYITTLEEPVGKCLNLWVRGHILPKNGRYTVYTRPCKIQCTFYWHRVVNIIAPLFCTGWTPILRLKMTSTNPAFRGCRLLVLVFWFSPRKFGAWEYQKNKNITSSVWKKRSAWCSWIYDHSKMLYHFWKKTQGY